MSILSGAREISGCNMSASLKASLAGAHATNAARGGGGQDGRAPGSQRAAAGGLPREGPQAGHGHGRHVPAERWHASPRRFQQAAASSAKVEDDGLNRNHN